MNKKEQAYVEELKTQLALRWTQGQKADVAPPASSSGSQLSIGFAIRGERGDYPSIEEACSSSVSHGIGRADKTTTQHPIWLYSTKLLALKALRHSVERRCAAMLRKIDAMIEAEEQG